MSLVTYQSWGSSVIVSPFFLALTILRQNLVEGAAPAWSAATGTGAVDENVASGTAITVTQTLTNTPTSVAIQSSTPAGGSSLFAVALNGAATGVTLTTAGTIDAETSTTYALTIRATNADGTDDLVLTVTVNDLNDVDPAFISSVTGLLVPVDTPASTDIVAIKATDGDATAANNVVTHTFSTASTVFDIDGTTAMVSTKVGQTLSTDGMTYKLTIKATDSGTTARTATAILCICVGADVTCNANQCTISGATGMHATILTSALLFLLTKML